MPDHRWPWAAALVGSLACADPAGSIAHGPSPGTREPTVTATVDPEPTTAPSPAPRVGATIGAFDVIDSRTGARDCPPCRARGVPLVFGVGRPDDEEFAQDLLDLAAVLDKHGRDRARLFAVAAEPSAAGLGTSQSEPLMSRARALSERLGDDVPVGALPAGDPAWPSGFRPEQERTLVFADAEHVVRWVEVAPEHLAALDAALRELPSGARHSPN
jgi:hypothetical protein